MKDTKKLVLIILSLYVFSVISMTCLYFFLHHLTEISSSNIIHTITKITLIAAIIPTLVMFLIYCSIKKVKSIFLMSVSIFILVLIFLFVMYWHIVNMVFYQLEDKESFISSLISALE